MHYMKYFSCIDLFNISNSPLKYVLLVSCHYWRNWNTKSISSWLKDSEAEPSLSHGWALESTLSPPGIRLSFHISGNWEHGWNKEKEKWMKLGFTYQEQVGWEAGHGDYSRSCWRDDTLMERDYTYPSLTQASFRPSPHQIQHVKVPLSWESNGSWHFPKLWEP